MTNVYKDSYPRRIEKENEELKAKVKALAEELRRKEWQDIDLAPKDGTDILVGNEDEFQAVASWWVEGWFSSCSDYTTHPLPLCFTPTKFQPLPQPPKED